MENNNTKYCNFCGAIIPADAVVCTNCGRQVEAFANNQQPQPTVVVNNSSNSYSSSYASATANGFGGRQKNKWTAFFLCLFLGYLGAHKFY